MKGTDLIKELIPWPTAAWTKSVISAVLVVVAGILVGAEVLVIGGAWGAAAAVHEITACLSMISDDKKQQIFLRSTAGRRQMR
ncbi:MAG TPA: hypothetical protein VFI41_04580 [Gemmatimonadales bacterium]|nr:hypothetical protein [Gemmatimonadales bacterium]